MTLSPFLLVRDTKSISLGCSAHSTPDATWHSLTLHEIRESTSEHHVGVTVDLSRYGGSLVRGVVHGRWKLFTLRTFPNWVKHIRWFRLLRFSALCCGANSPRHRFKHCQANTTLRVLVLSENLIGNEGACALAVALKAPVVVCKAFCGGCSASLHSCVSNLARDVNEVHALRTPVSRSSSAPLCRDCTPQVCQCES